MSAMPPTTIYHGTPLTPARALPQLAGRHFCVSFWRPDSVVGVEAVAAGVMYDCGEFSRYTQAQRLGLECVPLDPEPYYGWLEPRLFHPGRWAVIPDVIDAGSQLQDAMLATWPFGHRGAPVWHTDEPMARLLRLIQQGWPRICIGSSGEHWQVGSDVWRARMDEVWQVLGRQRALPAIHMLRGTAVAHLYPFASADSTSLAQNSHRYRMPLFAGTPAEFSGLVAYADKLERRRA